MKKPNIEKLKLHNKNIMNKSLAWDSIKTDSFIEKYYLAKGWFDALNYITNNYKLEEK